MNFNHLEKTKEEFIKTANSQERKGIEKYGKPLDPLDNYDWLKMAKEEQVDGFKYMEAELEKRTFVINQIRKRTDDVEILHYLEMLEGS